MSIVNKILPKLPKIFTPIILLNGKIFLSSRSQEVLRWKLSDGDNTFCVNYPLENTSVVFDLGGYKGDWSSLMNKKYHCTIYIFEPVKEYVDILKNRFLGQKNIHILPFGLADKTRSTYLHMSKNATSEFGTSQELVKIKLVNAKEFITKYKIKQVDLVSINIEGGEYELLEYLLKASLVKKLKNIQVQFHPFVSNAPIRAKKIQNALKKTHKLQYQFPFVWENWKIKEL